MSKRTLAVLLLIASPAWGQDLVQNWTTEQSKAFDQQDPGNISYVLNGVNSFYYVYSTAITSKDQSQSDYDLVKNFIVPPQQQQGVGASANPCIDRIKAVQDAVNKMTLPTLDNTTHTYSSKTLAETQNDWNNKVAADYAALISGSPDCSKVDGFTQITQAHDRLFPANNIPSVTVSIAAKACKNYTITISEFYEGVTTSKAVTATFSTGCDQLTLSAGTLLTEIPNRTYNSRSSPTQTGQFLSIENTGKFRPTVLALLNYNLPQFVKGTWGDPFRLALSTGPVLQNSQNGASSFGWFFGGSLSLFKRLYISAGEHWGQFADTPFGLENGDPIPASFGQLTPRLRYTSRFAIGITFQTADLSKAFNGGAASVNATAKPSQK